MTFEVWMTHQKDHACLKSFFKNENNVFYLSRSLRKLTRNRSRNAQFQSRNFLQTQNYKNLIHTIVVLHR